MLKVRIINPDQLVYEGEVEYVIAPGVKGDLGIMSGHTPMYAELVKGTVHLTGAKEESFEIEAGILKIRADEVTILIGII